METKPGTRVCCETCGSELIIVNASGPALACCGQPVSALTPGGAAARPGA